MVSSQQIAFFSFFPFFFSQRQTCRPCMFEVNRTVQAVLVTFG